MPGALVTDAYLPAAFQSAPGLEAGRCRIAAALPAARGWFQSAPGLEAGRCLAIGLRLCLGPDVSIRARPRGRAMPVIEPWPLSVADLVSIRARPRGRAMRDRARSRLPSGARFNPRPA